MLNARIKKRLGSDSRNSLMIEVDLAVAEGITVLFGHSGAGKTSILRAIAGTIMPDEGRITLDEKTFFDSAGGISLAIQQRRVGYVFQDHTLFPHMTAEENVLYGAKPHATSSARARVRELFSMMAIEKTAARYPHELSGGEQQRIALARALASEPLIMLLDEPLSAVDEATRSRLLKEISEVQRKSGIPFLYVTHNQNEAVRLGDRMYVIHEGSVLQEGTPLEVFNAPRTLPVARAVGTDNLFVGRIAHHNTADGITAIAVGSCLVQVPFNGLPYETQVTVGIRSEDIIVSCERLTQTSARNVLEGVIKYMISDADATELVVACGVDFKVSITTATVRALDLKVGKKIYLLIKARALHILE
jgi:molybdate transport system ATP-binding protein